MLIVFAVWKCEAIYFRWKVTRFMADIGAYEKLEEWCPTIPFDITDTLRLEKWEGQNYDTRIHPSAGYRHFAYEDTRRRMKFNLCQIRVPIDTGS